MVLAGPQPVAIQDQVAVSTVEVTVRGGVHRHPLSLDTPNLEAKTTPCYPQAHHNDPSSPSFQMSALSYLDVALAIVHHAVLGGHGLVGVQGGGVEGHLGHLGDAADGVGLAGARGLVFVLPVAEELLEHGGLGSCRKNLDL